MDMQNIHSIHSGSARTLLNGGETPMPLAPSVELPNGKSWIPQQYLLYRQTEATVSAVLNDIAPLENMMLFSGQDENGVYLQAGTLGPDNYKRKQGSHERRLVYGRRWRIESYTPTSEVIQTAFLALKKASEHDVRELLTITSQGRTGTPFSTHIDLSLMAHWPELVLRDGADGAPADIAHWLDDIRFDQRRFHVDDVTIRRNGCILVDIALARSSSPFQRPGFEAFTQTLILSACNETLLMHELIAALVHHSDRLLEEQFQYRGLARFSHALDPRRIADLSVLTRNPVNRSEQFDTVRKQLNADIDALRAPVLGNDPLAERNRDTINRQQQLGGHLPTDKHWGKECSA